jgi:hypothetical protein
MLFAPLRDGAVVSLLQGTPALKKAYIRRCLLNSFRNSGDCHTYRHTCERSHTRGAKCYHGDSASSEVLPRD